MERIEAGEGNAVIVLIYRAVGFGGRKKKEKKDHAIVRGVCMVSYFLHAIGIQGDKEEEEI